MLRQKRLVANNQAALVKLLKENEHTAEWLLQEYVQKDTNGRYERLYFPKLLSIQEKEDIIEWMLSFNLHSRQLPNELNINC